MATFSVLQFSFTLTFTRKINPDAKGIKLILDYLFW